LQVELVDNLLRLDAEERVASLVCTDTTLELHCTDASLADQVVPGFLVTGGLEWGCVNQTSLEPEVITRRVLSTVR
jgi:hypothetical protein